MSELYEGLTEQEMRETIDRVNRWLWAMRKEEEVPRD